MVIRLRPGDDWRFECERGSAEVRFASISSVGGDHVSFAIIVNDELHDRVNTTVPHSWWPVSGQEFCPKLVPGDVLTLSAENGEIDVRLDLLEHEA